MFAVEHPLPDLEQPLTPDRSIKSRMHTLRAYDVGSPLVKMMRLSLDNKAMM